MFSLLAHRRSWGCCKQQLRAEQRKALALLVTYSQRPRSWGLENLPCSWNTPNLQRTQEASSSYTTQKQRLCSERVRPLTGKHC